MKYSLLPLLLVAALVAAEPAFAEGAQNPCNPCGAKAKNPCGVKAKNPCNPCGGKAKNPCNPCGGKAKNPCNPCGAKKGAPAGVPALNPCFKKHGTVFYVSDPMKRDSVSFTSSAPLEDFVGTTNEIKGYVVFDAKNPYRGVRGDLRVVVAGLKTGIPLRDEHMRSADWLDAARHPEIRLVVDGTRDIRLVKKGDGYRTFDMGLEGQLTLHGKTKAVRIPARITYLEESDRTRQRLPGHLLAGRAEFKVNLADFGIKGFKGVVGSKVSETIAVKVGVMASSKPAGGTNPCNPCAKNPCAKNPCNPCGAKNPCATKAR
ncbi:MAG: YceI family protein [Planctomycetota bacterium]|jgi:polyisoprenoid-binding protein YceI